MTLIVFVDTGALKANFDAGDEHHVRARKLMEDVRSRRAEVTGFVTTDYVIDEAVTLTRFAHSHQKAAELAEAALGSSFMEVVYCGEETFGSALELFRQHSDKSWSFTDCVSFAVMNARGIGTAFTFDSHFAQAGFDVVP